MGKDDHRIGARRRGAGEPHFDGFLAHLVFVSQLFNRSYLKDVAIGRLVIILLGGVSLGLAAGRAWSGAQR